MRIFFSVGEPSGDQHAAHLIAELQQRRSDVQCIGFGGPQMQSAGCRVDFQLTDLAVMGIFQVLPMLSKFVAVYRQAKRILDADKPDAVMLIDFPGFNWWIAKAAKQRGIPVYYYLPPQLWAWGPWRVKRVKRLIDHVMSPLQFETDWYRSRGIDCHFVGHPFFDEVKDYPLDREFVSQWSSPDGEIRNVGVLPGSRMGEVDRCWSMQLDAMQSLYSQNSNVRFLVASFKQSQLDECRKRMVDRNVELPIDFFVGKTSEIMEVADCCMMMSGSVSLELLARRTPAVVSAPLGPMERVLRPLIITCDYFSLPNLIAGYELMPEFPCAADVEKMVATLNEWLQDESVRMAQVEALDSLCKDVVKTGATARAVDYLLSEFPAPAVRRAA